MLDEAGRKDAEEHYQAELRKFQQPAPTSQGNMANDTPSKKPSPTASATQNKTSTSVSTQTKPSPQVQSSASHPQSGADAKERKPIPDKNLGKVTQVLRDAPPYAAPSLSKDRIYTPNTKSQLVGRPKRASDIVIMSNYVTVKSKPKVLYAYSLEFSAVHGDERVTFDRRQEIQEIFNLLEQNSVLDLSSTVWATDYKTLWCTQRLFPENTGPLFTGTHPYQQRSVVYAVSATVDDIRELKIEQGFREESFDKLQEHIRALNAVVTRSMRNYSASPNSIHSIKQIGPNKFFVDGGFRNITQLHAVRGYFTSIRPGTEETLLNINTATSAFLPCMLVSELVYKLAQVFRNNRQAVKYVEKLLKGAIVRITYRRQNWEGSNMDVNAEENRRKIFKHFGFEARRQKFFEMSKDKKGETDPNDKGTTVYNFLQKQNVQFFSTTEPDMLCVNVGKPTRMANQADDVIMRRHTVDGAVWIPAQFLEIVPNQPIKTLLGTQHTSDMIGVALRQPAQNAELIEKEGLVLLGLMEPNQPEMVCHSLCLASVFANLLYRIKWVYQLIRLWSDLRPEHWAHQLYSTEMVFL